MFGRRRSAPRADEFAHEDHLARMLSDALCCSIAPNMRAIAVEAIPSGARLHFLLHDDAPWDRWEIREEIVPEFSFRFDRDITIEVAIAVSGAEEPPSLPGRVVYRRREWIILDPCLKDAEGWIALCLGELLFAPPPRPFRLVMADGRTCDVRHLDRARLTADSLRIESAPGPDGRPPGIATFPFDQIAAIEPLRPRAT